MKIHCSGKWIKLFNTLRSKKKGKRLNVTKRDRNQTGGKRIKPEQPHNVHQTSSTQQLEAEVRQVCLGTGSLCVSFPLILHCNVVVKQWT